jgi:hypothetical protein
MMAGMCLSGEVTRRSTAESSSWRPMIDPFVRERSQRLSAWLCTMKVCEVVQPVDGASFRLRTDFVVLFD